MQQSAHKKKVAQELYYRQQTSRSPLLRVNTTGNKPPVHNRLGLNKKIINVNNKFTPTNQIENRTKLRRHIVQPEQMIRNNIIRRRNDKVRRMQSVQNRILKIRQNNQNPIKQTSQNNAGQKIRLRRMRQGPVNYTVQVLNTKTKPAFKHNVTTVLNQKLQEEIRLIQNKDNNHDEIPSIPIHPQGTGFTGTTLHDRFSHL